jgi:amino acid transporter
MSAQSTASSPKYEDLHANSIGLPGVLFQSITTMAPASAVSFSLVAALPYAGASLPLAVLIALVVCALIALNIGALAKYLPSAGGYFTYVSRGLGVQAGWMTGWLFDLAYLLIVPLQLLVLGPVADSFVKSAFHLSFGANGWAVWAMIFAVVVFALTYFGIKVSADVGVVLGTIEIAVFAILSIWLIATAGDNTPAVFTPAFSQQPGLGGWQGVIFGMIFVFLAFAGFESSAPLAEEAHNPRTTVPRAILYAAIVIGLFYVLCSYAGVIGWGASKISGYAADPNPWDTLAKRVWGPFDFIVILTILNSALANANAGVNAASRVLYAMGRIRTLPSSLSHLNRFGSPDIAIIVTMLIAVAATLLPGLVYGSSTAFALIGTIIVVPIVLVYALTCIAVPLFYRREHPEEFTVFRHIVLPVVPIIVLAFVLYYSFVPLPAAPLNLALPICIAWLVIGLIVVIALSNAAPTMLALSSKVYAEEE